MVRVLPLFLVATWCAAVCSAAVEKSYFLGEAKVSSEAGKPLGSQVLLLEKSQDRDKSLIVERAIVVKDDGAPEQHTMNITVNGDSFVVDDAEHTTQGSGVFFGPAWQWTYWKGNFKSANGVQIEVEDFLADPTIGVARKKLIGPDGKVFMYIDVTMKAITPQTFEILAKALLKK